MPTGNISTTDNIPNSQDQKTTNSGVRDFFWHCLFFASTAFLIWFWVNNPVLANYNLQLTGFLVFIYFLAKLSFFRKDSLIWETVIFTNILLVILSSTGGLGSSLFFLVYFLLFAISLLFDPPTTLTLTLTLTLFFANTLTSTHAALQLFSLLLFTPMAIYFGKQYLKLLETRQLIKIIKKEKKLLKKEGQVLESAVENEETDSLLWLSLNFKNEMLKIIHKTSELLADIGHLTLTQKEILQSIHESAKNLLKSGEKLKEKIDKETD